MCLLTKESEPSQATKDINKVGETETEVDCFILYGGSATELVKNYNV